MNDRLPGEIAALIQIRDTDGNSRLACILDAPSGAQTGVLTAPGQGFAGAVTFQPVPRLRELLVAQYPDVFSIGDAGESAPSAPSPDDPRGLRSGGGTRRAPGMIS